MKREVKISPRVSSQGKSRGRSDKRSRKNATLNSRTRNSAPNNPKSKKLSNRIAQRSAARKADLKAKLNLGDALRKLVNIRIIPPKLPTNPKYFQDPTLKNHRRHQSNFLPAPVTILIRLIVVAVGMSTILGSAMAISDSFHSDFGDLDLNPNAQPITQNQANPEAADLEQLFSLISVGKEIIPLKQELKTFVKQYPDLTASIFIADIANKTYVNLNATQAFAAASTIKIPVLVALFQDIDAGKIKLDEIWTMNKKDIGSGSGHMQYQPVGTKFSALNTATKMITISDNTATNMVIRRLGGVAALNQRFADWGLKSTKIRNDLPDLTGTNTTSSEDLSNLLLKVEGGNLVSLASRDRIFKIMGAVKRDTLLPQGLEQGATIVHKTGDIRSILGDSGIVDMPSGKRYIISVLVKRPDNSPQAKPFIQNISKLSYQYFKAQKSTSQTANPNNS